ncbi:flagellar biosynthesis anti-sigma factor FlgM [Acidihalobacter ferrooxydans]|uniref:Negative regulator of flagellin synthesis n=1 Tax=Acidihalobacter ferrooxydans TaxID=1765967 RepID=A0A1P8UGZ3_9GAMM|nr:flagellar biosynthesis anti-sigma factor FlgM [Acidihalobacter ferrooxydans]APZ43034.1 flagellar biosynthesis anti-sigma factor FlgM [Acidihalobacter ferrooxydans]
MSIDLKRPESLGIQAPAASSRTGKPEASPKESSASGTTSSPSAGAAGDSVTLTPAGMQLAQAGVTLSQQPVVDSQRVDQIRQKIQSGNYVIDPRRVADKLLGYEISQKK